MTEHIDPSTCKPGEVYIATVKGKRWVVVRYIALWLSTDPVGNKWISSDDVSDLVRMVPENEIEPKKPDWEILREANGIGVETEAWTSVSPTAEKMMTLADRLEDEHRAAQEKAAADAAREALIDKAAQSIALADESNDDGWAIKEHERETYRVMVRALADAGWRPEAVES